MKTTIHLMIILLLGILMFQGCTKVSEPYYTIKSVVVDTNKRAVLLEDYTGHLCVNCAPAATFANTIEELNVGQVFVIAVHAGPFARPNPDSYPPYLAADYRCATGNDWYGYSGFNIDVNPKGMVNRRNYNGAISFDAYDWNEAVEEACELPKIAAMTVHQTINSETKILKTDIGVRFITGYTGQVNLTVCIVEDSIYGGQLNIIPPDSTPIIKNFRFMHVLRGSLNGSFGEGIAIDPDSHSIFSKTYTFDLSTTSWIPQHCSVIAFISDNETKEVLHVAKSSGL
jgi:hypothetical protein